MGLTGWQEEKRHQATRVERRVERTKPEMEALVLSSGAVQSASLLVDQFTQRGGGGGSFGLKRAEHIVQGMASDMNKNRARPAAYLLRKMWRSLYDSVNVDEVGLGRVRSLLEGSTDSSEGGDTGEKKNKKKKKGTVIFVPTHRSYVDFIILSYIFFAYNMPLPYIAAGDWMEKMGPLASMMKVRTFLAYCVRSYFFILIDL